VSAVGAAPVTAVRLWAAKGRVGVIGRSTTCAIGAVLITAKPFEINHRIPRSTSRDAMDLGSFVWGSQFTRVP